MKPARAAGSPISWMNPPAWLPNAISSLRLVLVPVWVAAATGAGPFGPEPARLAAAATIGAIGLSDVVDGYLARRFGATSNLGAALDAIADKLAQLVVVLLLAIAPPAGFYPVPLWFVALLIVRDLTMIIGLALIWARCAHLQVSHQWHGKASSLLMFTLMVAVHFTLPPPLMTVGFVVGGVLLLVSTGMYAKDGIGVLRRGVGFTAR